jgi:nickel-type superoxide dismutase maturation protease
VSDITPSAILDSGGCMRWPIWRVAVAESSMQPALDPGDWLLVRRAMRPGRVLRLEPGQVVVARHPGQPDLLLVKRAARREPGGWWLASDNPGAGAVDSRAFGPVPPGLIEGRVLLRYHRGRPAAPDRG